jgi:hypothetical protein
MEIDVDMFKVLINRRIIRDGIAKFRGHRSALPPLETRTFAPTTERLLWSIEGHGQR